MLRFLTGDMLKCDAQALVNTVNTVGVMGKGIALQFKEAFPANNKVYVDVCKRKELAPGKLLSVWEDNLLLGRKLIVNFPTKTHWRSPSKYEYIESGLIELRKLIQEKELKTIALPPLGCGNGGLDWNIVKQLIQKYLGDLQAEVMVFEPNAQIKAILQQQDRKAPVKLTPARAQLLYLLFAFESMGEPSSLFAANKLAYFLQRLGENLKLKFVPHHYGPYAVGVEKVLYHLNGVYLKGLEQGEAKPFEALLINYEKWSEIETFIKTELSEEGRTRIRNLFSLIGNFCSELSLEVLATTDFILNEHPNYSLDEVLSTISQWSIRKSKLFRADLVATAYAHLRSHTRLLGYKA